MIPRYKYIKIGSTSEEFHGIWTDVEVAFQWPVNHREPVKVVTWRKRGRGRHYSVKAAEAAFPALAPAIRAAYSMLILEEAEQIRGVVQ